MMPTHSRRTVYRTKGHYRVLRDEFTFTAGFTDHNFQTDTTRRKKKKSIKTRNFTPNVILKTLSCLREHDVENHLVWSIQRSRKQQDKPK
jgi:hypothetical protein